MKSEIIVIYQKVIFTVIFYHIIDLSNLADMDMKTGIALIGETALEQLV